MSQKIHNEDEPEGGKYYLPCEIEEEMFLLMLVISQVKNGACGNRPRLNTLEKIALPKQERIKTGETGKSTISRW